MTKEKAIKKVEEYIKGECLLTIGSLTYPRIEKLDFINAKKQYNVKNLEKDSGEYNEYQQLINCENAWNSWIKLKKIMCKKRVS